jgi:hypothetical protein
MITKINAHKIKHQPNIEIFVWDCDNLVKKIKINYTKKDFIERKENWKMEFFKKKNSHCY